MGNCDGIVSGMLSVGKNDVMRFDGGHFSFAFGNEIALCIDGNYYILNCGEKLWSKVMLELESTKAKGKLIKFWIKQKKDHDVNEWSNKFSELSKSQ